MLNHPHPIQTQDLVEELSEAYEKDRPAIKAAAKAAGWTAAPGAAPGVSLVQPGRGRAHDSCACCALVGFAFCAGGAARRGAARLNARAL